jgi:hypothetical protein
MKVRLAQWTGFIIGAGVFPLAAASAGAATYYVAKTGNDSNACKTAATACLSIGHAQGLAVSPGDVIQVGVGTYTENVNLTHSGSSAGGNIVLRGQPGTGCPTTPVADVNSPTGTRPAPTVTIVGNITMAANYLTADCFHIETAGKGAIVVNSNTSYGVISNIDIDGHGAATTGGGLGFTGSVPSAQYASHYTVTGNYIHGVSTGIWFWCNSCMVTNNEITALAGDEPGTDHDYIDAWGIGSTFRHNYMHDNTCNSCEGYDCHMDCIQTWNTTGDGTEVSKNMTFDRNICFNHHEGVIVQDNAGNGDVGGWTVSNNVFAYAPYDDGSGHLCVAGVAHPWCWIFEDGSLGTNSFLNNTCVDGAEGFRSNSGSAQFKDNLFLSLLGESVVYQTAGATTTGANNLYFATTATFGSGTYPGDIVNKDPKIVNAGTGESISRCLGCNFAIQSTSAAKDAGIDTGVGFDLLGIGRPQGPAYDIGAYEFVPTTKPAPPTGLNGVVH